MLEAASHVLTTGCRLPFCESEQQSSCFCWLPVLFGPNCIKEQTWKNFLKGTGSLDSMLNLKRRGALRGEVLFVVNGSAKLSDRNDKFTNSSELLIAMN